jgi:hypothetical protein
MYKKSKKGFSEITSFVLLVSLILITSIIAYNFSQDLVERKLAQDDRANMDFYLKKMDLTINQISNYDGETGFVNIDFSTGRLVFENNQIYYFSEVEYNDNETYCFNDICFFSDLGYETIYLNLTSPNNFSERVSLIPGYYALIFRNENGDEIDVSFK